MKSCRSLIHCFPMRIVEKPCQRTLFTFCDEFLDTKRIWFTLCRSWRQDSLAPYSVFACQTAQEEAKIRATSAINRQRGFGKFAPQGGYVYGPGRVKAVGKQRNDEPCLRIHMKVSTREARMPSAIVWIVFSALEP